MKLRKLGISLAVAVFVGVMIFNAQLVYKNSDPVSRISLEALVQVAMAQEEEGSEDDCDNLIWGCDDLYYDVLTNFDCTEETCIGIPPYVQCDNIPGKLNDCENGGPDFCWGGRCITPV